MRFRVRNALSVPLKRGSIATFQKFKACIFGAGGLVVSPSFSSDRMQGSAHSPGMDGFRRAIRRIGVRIPFGTEFFQSLRDFARQRLWSWWAFRRATASELGNLGQRIQMQYRTKLHRHGAYLGPSGRISPNGCQTSCAATFGRIADMQRMLANHPKATGWDQE